MGGIPVDKNGFLLMPDYSAKTMLKS